MNFIISDHLGEVINHTVTLCRDIQAQEKNVENAMRAAVEACSKNAIDSLLEELSKLSTLMYALQHEFNYLNSVKSELDSKIKTIDANIFDTNTFLSCHSAVAEALKLKMEFDQSQENPEL